MQRVEFHFRVTKPVTQFRDLRLIAIVQVLARAEDFHRQNSRLLDAAQQRRSQAMIDKQVRGKYVIHSECTLDSTAWRWGRTPRQTYAALSPASGVGFSASRTKFEKSGRSFSGYFSWEQ